jgi:D-3-phosphoglycerate dehydrogenase
MNARLRAEMSEKFAQVRFYEDNAKLEGGDLVAFLKGCRGAVIALNQIDSGVLSALPELRCISKYGVGLNNIDQDALARHGVKFGWTGGVNRRAVSELTLGYMLSLVRRIYAHNRNMAAGVWKLTTDGQLTGKTVGIIGCGHIGTDLLSLLAPFQCRLLVHDIVDKREVCARFGARQVTKSEVLAESDLVTLHVPYDDSTHHLIGAPELGAMRAGALLINTSRGSVIDEAALLNALSSGRLGGAALDVFAEEPAAASPLLKLPNFIASPHIGGTTDEGVLAMGRAAIANLVELMQKS